jgi:glycosyltransferase involved in cell wall biosynthesis
MLSNQSSDALPVQYSPYLGGEQLLEIQTQADVLVSFRNLSPQYGIINHWNHSSKLYEYLLARRPILSTDYPAIAPETRQYLHLVPDNSLTTLVAALDDLITHPPTSEQLERGARYVEKLNDPATNVELLTKFLDL